MSLRALLVICVVGPAAFVGWAAAADFSFTPAQRQRALLQSELLTVHMALEQYGTDHDGRYPRDAEIAQALFPDHYLPGNRLGANPYGPPGSRFRLVGDPAAAAKPGTPSAYAPGTLVYHLGAGGGTYSLIGVHPMTKP